MAAIGGYEREKSTVSCSQFNDRRAKEAAARARISTGAGGGGAGSPAPLLRLSWFTIGRLHLELTVNWQELLARKRWPARLAFSRPGLPLSWLPRKRIFSLRRSRGLATGFRKLLYKPKTPFVSSMGKMARCCFSSLSRCTQIPSAEPMV